MDKTQNAFEAIIKERNSRPVLEKIYYWFYRKYNSLRYWFRRQYQRWTTGFAHEEAWDFVSWHPRMVAPRLKCLRDNLHGHPGTLNSLEEWRAVLDEIIWAFENSENEPEPIYPEGYDKDWLFNALQDENRSKIIPPEGKIDFSPVYKHYEKVQKGVDLFAKYYLHLWD